MAVGATGIAAVLGISLLSPSGGATPALPALVSDNPVNYTPTSTRARIALLPVV